MPRLVEGRTLVRMSHYAQHLKRRHNGENIVRLMLFCVLAGLVVLLFQRHEQTMAIAADVGRQSGRRCNE